MVIIWRSLIIRIKSQGPSLVPWGTPDGTEPYSAEQSVESLTCWCLSKRESPTQQATPLAMRNAKILSASILWSTRSNAFWSRSMTLTSYLVHPCLRPSAHHWNESLQGRWFWNGAKLIGMNAFCCNLIRALHSGVTQEASFTCNLMVLQMSVVWWCLDWSWLCHKKAGACFDSWARKQVQTSQGSPSTCWARIYN